MKEIAIVAACRTPIGSFGGAFRDYSAVELGKTVVREVIRRAGINPEIIDEVVVGAAGQPYNAANVARVIALAAGIPEQIPAYSVQRNCASSLQAITSAVQEIKAGDADVILAAGVENLSQAPYLLVGARWGYRLQHGTVFDSIWSGLTDPITGIITGATAEHVADRYGISREDQDRFALESHNRAFRAVRMGKFKDEIVPVAIPKGAAEPETVIDDESPQAGLSLQKLALYPTVFKANGTVTPGNSCPLNDAGAAVLLMSAEKAKDLDVPIMAYIRSYAYAGVDPAYMGIGPTTSTPLALAKAGLRLDDIQLVELNEAFAAQYLAVERLMGLNRETTNVNGGAIALGHPIGATGIRLTVTLLYEMAKRGLALGLVTLCIGGGQGGSMVIERR
ncbi:MAG: thiolase family protein [Chloroflexi bacterium]|nr:thiolase family protein [Chloroflexota bacterium]